MNRRLLMLFALSFAVPPVQHARCSEELWLYGRQSNVEFSFDVNIKVESGGMETAYRGSIIYSVDRITDEQVQMTYRGQLQQHSAQPIGSPGRGVVVRQPPQLPGFLGRSVITGTTMQTNQITLSRSGEVLTLDGSSQMPFLLGHASLLPFETLPSNDLPVDVLENHSWSVDSTVSISQHKSSALGLSRIASDLLGKEENKIQFARSETRYSLIERSNQLAKIKKATRLSSPEVTGEVRYEMSGEGVWEFDLETGLPNSAAYTLELKLVENNVQVVYPIRISYRRVPDEAHQARQAALKRMREKDAAEQAEQRRLATIPLDDPEKAAALQSLQSDKMTDVIRALHELSRKQPESPDPELLAAIRSKLMSPDRAVASAAERLMMRWSAEYAQWSKINKSYQDGGLLPSSGKPVALDTPLSPGQLVQFKQHRMIDRWQPAEVVAVLEDSTVMLRPRGMMSNRLIAVPRDQILLAPDEVDQPGRPGVGSPYAAASGSPSPRSAIGDAAHDGVSHVSALPETLMMNEPRRWTDVTGEYRIEATLLEMIDGQVRLRRTDGKEIKVPLDKLSEQDRQYINQLEATQAKSISSNPFE
jgi:hypothetical protein